jgi:hypothetical protein
LLGQIIELSGLAERKEIETMRGKKQKQYEVVVITSDGEELGMRLLRRRQNVMPLGRSLVA